jgi:hypothetical protein
VRAAHLGLLLLTLVPGSAGPIPASWPTKTGYVVHFDFLRNAAEARDLVRIAVRAGAGVINVVPPAHVWENPTSVAMLDTILAEASRLNLSIIFTRIDAAHPPDAEGKRYYYLYSELLTEPGVMPDGSATAAYFKTTVGLDDYAAWMEEETRYYGTHYGRLPNLIGINLGPFSEPFASERGGFLEYLDGTGRYEISQYTPAAGRAWHRWLQSRFGSVAKLDAAYGTAFGAFEAVPMPKSEVDPRFGKPDLAYYDFARSINDWFVERYERCRSIWHETSGRRDVPLLLQFAGNDTEKMYKAQPGLAAFDLPGWIARADAIGLSLYSNTGYPDRGHATMTAVVRLAGTALSMKKDVFVLEGGFEAPNVLLDPAELEFFGTIARRLRPRTYIYEFLKYKFDEPYASNPGKLVRADGSIQRPAFRALRGLMGQIRASHLEPERPLLYGIVDSSACRGDRAAGLRQAAFYELAESAAVRLVPAGGDVVFEPDVPRVATDGSVTPPDAELGRLFRVIPPFDSFERTGWRRAVLDRLRAIAGR